MKMKGPVEVTLTRPDPPSRRRWRRDDDDYVDDGDVAVLRIGRGLAVVDTAFSTSDEATRRWLADAAAASRGRRLRAPLVAGLVALRGHHPADRHRYAWGRGGFSASDPSNPIRGLALCLGGSRALVYCPDAHGYRDRKPKHAAPGRLQFCGGNGMAQLRAFLDDRCVTIACVGAREVTRKLATEWGLHVAFPDELTDLFACAYGEEAGVEAPKRPLINKPAKFWLGKAALAREKARADRDGHDTDDDEEDLGRYRTWPTPKVVRGLSLERMARVAIGPEMRLARPPRSVAQADWGAYDLGEEDWAYATRDAYLCFEIAARCLQKLGLPIGP